MARFVGLHGSIAAGCALLILSSLQSSHSAPAGPPKTGCRRRAPPGGRPSARPTAAATAPVAAKIIHRNVSHRSRDPMTTTVKAGPPPAGPPPRHCPITWSSYCDGCGCRTPAPPPQKSSPLPSLNGGNQPRCCARCSPPSGTGPRWPTGGPGRRFPPGRRTTPSPFPQAPIRRMNRWPVG